MNINLDLYKIFRAVAENQSFSAAAKELYISQPAISQAMNQLESQLEVALFIRTSRGVRLTNEGKILYDYVNSALSLILAGENKLLHMSKLLYGEIKISAGDTISKHYLLPFLEEFNNLYPDIKVKVINRTSKSSIELLKSGSVDIAFANLPVDEENVITKPCVTVHDIFVAGDKYKNIFNGVVSYQDIGSCPLIMLEKRSRSRIFIDKCFLQEGIVLEPEIELGSHDLLLEFAKIGLGISCVVREFSKEYLNSGELQELQIEKSIPSRDIGICFLRDVPLSFAAQKFIDMIDKK